MGDTKPGATRTWRIAGMLIGVAMLAGGCGQVRESALTPAPDGPEIELRPSTPVAEPDMPLVELDLEELFPDIDLPGLVHLTWPDDGGRALYAVLQGGEIWRIDPAATPTAALYLDITDRVRTTGDEEGLLGLAFDPGFASNGRLFVYYSASDPRRSVVSGFIGDGSQADPDSEVIVLEVAQPFANHNGGHLEFGPDGMLYVALGDGGSAGDPRGNGQNLSTLLGAILRIDVSAVSASDSYAVPGDNPFVGVAGARPEIWAYGLRNPWRFAFDPATGLLWAGDVGQNRLEEIDVIERGGNYGWSVMEGPECFDAPDCSRDGLIGPVAVYDHSQGCSVTGGRVYRSNRLPSLSGAYVYGDFCSGIIWALRYDGAQTAGRRVIEQREIVPRAVVRDISSFAVDRSGDVLVLSLSGRIYRFKEK